MFKLIMKRLFLIITLAFASNLAMALQVIDLTTRVTNTAVSSGSIITIPGLVTNADFTTIKSNNVIIGDTINVAFQKVNTNFLIVQTYMATNGSGNSATATNLAGNALIQSTNIAAYQAYLATNNLVLTNLSASTTNLSGYALIQSTNIAAYQAYLATNNLLPTITNIAIYQAFLATNGLNLSGSTGTATNLAGNALIQSTNIAAYQAYLATNGLVLTNLAASTTNLSGYALVQSTNIAAYQAYLATNNLSIANQSAIIISNDINRGTNASGTNIIGGTGLSLSISSGGLAGSTPGTGGAGGTVNISSGQIANGSFGTGGMGGTVNLAIGGSAASLGGNGGNVNIANGSQGGTGGIVTIATNNGSTYVGNLTAYGTVSGNGLGLTNIISTNISGLGTAAFSNSSAFILNNQNGVNLGYTAFTSSKYQENSIGSYYYSAAGFNPFNLYLGNTNFPEAQNTNMGIVFAPNVDGDSYLGATNSKGFTPKFLKFYWRYQDDIRFNTNFYLLPYTDNILKIGKDLSDNGNDYVEAYNDLLIDRDLRVARTNYASAFIGTNLIIAGYSTNLILTYINEIGSYVIDGSGSEGYDVILTNLNLRIEDNFTIYANGFGLKHIQATNLDGIGTASYSNATAFALSGVTNLTANQLLIISSALTNANAFDTNGSSAAIKTAILNSNYVTMAVTNGLATTNYVQNSTNNLPFRIWTLGTASQSNSTAFASSSVTNLTANQLAIINSALTNSNAYDTNGAATAVKTAILNSNYVTASITNGLPSAIWTLGTASQSNASAFALSSITNLTPGQIGTISLALTNAYATNVSGVIVNGNKVFISTNYAGIGITNLTGGQLQAIADSITNNFTGARILIDTNNLATNILGGSVVQMGNSLLAGFNSTNQTFPIWTNASSFTFTNSNFILGNSCIAYKNSAFSIVEGYQSWASGSFGVALGFRSRIGDPAFSGVTGGVAIGYNVGTYNDYGVAMGQAVSNTMASSFAWHDGFSSTYNAHAIQSFNVMAHGGIYLEGGTIYGNGNGISNIPSTSITGGVTTNLQFTFNATRTNTLYFTNGILIKVTQP